MMIPVGLMTRKGVLMNMYGVQFVLRGKDASRLFRKLHEAEITARNLSRLHGTVKVYRMKSPLELVFTFIDGEKK